MTRVYWDTMLFAYLIEDNPEYAGRISAIRERMIQRRDQLVTSAFTLGELLVPSYRNGDSTAAGKIEGFFSSSEIMVVPFGIAAAARYAHIRAAERVKAADAIHLACAAEAKVDLFLTNDAQLVGRTIPDVKFIAGLNTDLF